LFVVCFVFAHPAAKKKKFVGSETKIVWVATMIARAVRFAGASLVDYEYGKIGFV
jgi:hypothetical protein